MTTTIEAANLQISRDHRLADALVRGLPSASRPLAELLERLRSGRGLYAVHETAGASRASILASTYRSLGGQLLVVVPTADVAERTFADLLYYLGDDEALSFVRPRDETIGAIEGPSERSARMALLAELLDARGGIVIAPLGAIRQYVMPRELFRELRLTLHVNEDAGWEETLARLHLLGYNRTDVVSAAGEYAVRGGILDVFPPCSDSAVRVEFFGDTVESIRPFDLVSQRSSGTLQHIRIDPWTEIPRDARYRERIIERFSGPANVKRALSAYLEAGNEIPEPWLSLAYDERETLIDYLRPEAIVAIEEPSMLATVERALDDERSREESVLLSAVESGELSVNESEVTEALLAEVAAPYPRLNDTNGALRARRTIVFPGAIEGAEPTPWLPESVQNFVLPTQPAEHFNRQIDLFTQSLREWVGAGDTVLLVSSGVGRTSDVVRAAGLTAERNVGLLHLNAVGREKAVGRVLVDQGNIEAGFTIPDVRLRVLGDREIYGQPAKRVKLRAVKEGVPVTLADLKVGDYVVHAVHGIGQYLGLRTEAILGATQDYLDLKYAGSDRMLVPVTQMHQISKYSASEGGSPRLSKMGGADWARTKSRVSESLAKIADGLVQLYAEREMAKGFDFGVDTP
ncbi:MAG: hypothetical protein JO165_03950, partial [Candidatus Eremiobacteraeota bacterium]|nr:hypothetical protein [Candidatus Eremiobacteraeota bacterium]